MKPGVYDIPLADYLRDPCPAPSLSSGIANTLLARSPAHAWHKYNDERQEYRRDAAIGTVFHALLLGKGGEYEVIEASDFRTKAAKEARDAALEAGRTPIKAVDFETAEAMETAAVAQLESHEIGNFMRRPGKSEQTIVWREENGIWCRCCVDRLPEDLEAEGAIYDIKTSTCAHPDVWVRRVYDSGYDLSAAVYLRGVQKVLGFDDLRYRFVVVEAEPPHGLSVIELAPSALDMAEKKRAAAVALWGECLERQAWPSYPARICAIFAPPWKEAEFENKQAMGRYDPSMLDELLEAYAP